MGNGPGLDTEFSLGDETVERSSKTRRPNRFERRTVKEWVTRPKLAESSGILREVKKTFSFFNFLLNDSKAKEIGQTRSSTLQIDVPLVLIVSTLVIFGLLMVYSASWKFSLADFTQTPGSGAQQVFIGSPTKIFWRQAAYTGLGIGAVIFLIFLNYHRLIKLVLPLLGVALILLVLVLFIHDERLGAVRSLLQGSIQPSELAKLAIVLYLSVWLYNRREQLHDLSIGLAPMGVILGVVAGLIVLQPDFSAMITIFVLGGMLFFLAGGDLKQIIFTLVLGGIVGYLMVQSNFVPTARERVVNFWAGLKDPLQASDHVVYSMGAFVKGGLFGVGIGKADMKLTILPFPHTDSIFAVVGEETGFLGASMLVLLYGLFMWRSLVIAKRAPDRLGALLAGGLGFWIALEALINMAVMVGLLPFAGNALPLISAGGSNRVVTLVAIGIILNVSRTSFVDQEEKERSINAVVDLRRRDWRRSVSRSRRPTASTKDSK